MQARQLAQEAEGVVEEEQEKTGQAKMVKETEEEQEEEVEARPPSQVHTSLRGSSPPRFRSAPPWKAKAHSPLSGSLPAPSPFGVASFRSAFIFYSSPLEVASTFLVSS